MPLFFMRVAIILPSVHWNCPYADIYANLFDKNGVQYDMISFNRKLDQEDTKYHFDYKLNNNSGHLKKFVALLKYCAFVKKVLKKEKYDRLVVFSSQIGIGLLVTLVKHYRGQYIFDYRDLSIEQHLAFPFRILLKNSFINVISSPGFLRVLPQKYNYEICHNFNVETAINEIKNDIVSGWKKGSKHILTIGGIRDFEANKEVIDAIKNRDNYSLSFVGRGECSAPLNEYCKKIGASNVSFVGFYKKDEEKGYILNSDFINIYYPRLLSHDTALSKRFYNSLIYKKPMITTDRTTQGDFASNYRVGVAIKDCGELIEQLESFIEDNSFVEYCERCNKLLEVFIKEQLSFESHVLDFIS